MKAKTRIMKNSILSIVMLIGAIVPFLAAAQPPDFNDLKILFADRNYEKLVKQAEKYTTKEDLAKNPVPYLWMSRGLYEISLSGTDNANFKNAYKDATSFLGKAISKDKDGTQLADHREFIDTFQISLARRIVDDISIKDYAKAGVSLMNYSKVTRNADAGAKYLDGALKFMKGDKGGANPIWLKANEVIAKKPITSMDDWSDADKLIFKLGIMYTSECYVKAKKLDKAKALISAYYKFYEEDQEYKTRHDEIVK